MVQRKDDNQQGNLSRSENDIELSDQEQKRKAQYEQNNKAYRSVSDRSSESGDKKEAAQDSLKNTKLPSQSIQSGDKEEDEGTEKDRKINYEMQKKSAWQKKKEQIKEELKEKGAEAVGSFFMLPPFVSRFIYHHKALVISLIVGIVFFSIILVVTFLSSLANMLPGI